MGEVQIKVTVNKNGQATIEHGRLSPLEASLILSQVCVQLQANAIQASGSPVLAAPSTMPGLRLS